MAFITGPRQVGKTTLAKMLSGDNGKYCNWDDLDFRRVWTKSPKSIIQGLKVNSTLILDEIHRIFKWKQNLKGLYDTLEQSMRIVITGSARLDIYKKGSDSLMGRYLGLRLHPFSLGEMLSDKLPSPEDIVDVMEQGSASPSSKDCLEAWDDLWAYGGFPEPLLGSSQRILNLWQKGRIDKIVREDLRDLSRIPELSKIEMLVALLPERVAGPLGLASLREDVEASYDAVRRWMQYLRELYYHFELRPWAKRLARTLKRESKLYLWDWSEVKNAGARFENISASHLLKACHYWTDTGEGKFKLHYLKTKDKREVDFLISKDDNPWMAIECKLENTNLSPHLSWFASALDIPISIQLVNRPNLFEQKKIGEQKVWVCSAPFFFRYLP